MKNRLIKIKEGINKLLKDPLFLRRWEWPYEYRHQDEDQISVRIIARRRYDQYAYKGDAFMFVEDIHAGVAPFMLYRGDREKYPMTITPASREKEALISAGLGHRGYPTFLADAVCDFIRSATHTLFQNGVAIYEIVLARSPAGEITSFNFAWIEPVYLFRGFKNYYQIVPWWIAKESHARVQIIKIPKDKILRIDFPSRWGGARKLRKILKRLWWLSKEPIPSFQMDSMKKNQNSGFDFSEFLKAKYIEIAKLTRDVGWNQRQTSGENITEHYSMQRYLRERRAQAIVRRLIINKANEALNGPMLKLDTSIVAESILGESVIDAQEAKLFEGDVSFTDVLKITNL